MKAHTIYTVRHAYCAGYLTAAFSTRDLHKALAFIDDYKAVNEIGAEYELYVVEYDLFGNVTHTETLDTWTGDYR